VRDWTILIVDDNAAIRDLIRTVLDLHDEGRFVTVDADSAATAVTAWQRTAPDAVVLDLRLGVDDGFEVAARILAEQPDLPVVLYTAYLTDEIQNHAAELGVAACLTQDELTRLPALLGDVLG